MLVYDVGNRESFDALDSWLEEIKKDIGSPADFEGVAFAVCANKVRRSPGGSTPLYGLYRYVPRNRVGVVEVLNP